MTTGIIHTVYSVGFPWALARFKFLLELKVGEQAATTGAHVRTPSHDSCCRI